MTGTLFAILTFAAAIDYRRSGKIRDLWPLGFFSLLTAGVAPSNLAALAVVIIYAVGTSELSFSKRNLKQICAIIFTPAAAAVLFYLPIAAKLLKAYQLGEGRKDGDDALMQLAAAAIFTFIVILPIACIGTTVAWKHLRQRRKIIFGAMIWLLPVPMMLIPETAPFPRVFVPLLPFFAILTAKGIRHAEAAARKRSLLCNESRSRIYAGVLILIIIIFGAVIYPDTLISQKISAKTAWNPEYDDCFDPHYMRKSHRPDLTASNEILQPCKNIYMSFNADPWALMFYRQIAGNSSGVNFEFDGPRGKVSSLKRGSAVILRRDEDKSAIEERFNCRLGNLFENTNHRVFFVL
jgi:hypothetical protein